MRAPRRQGERRGLSVDYPGTALGTEGARKWLTRRPLTFRWRSPSVLFLREGAGEAETGHSDNSPFFSFQPSVCSLWKIRTIQNKEENKNGLPLSCHSKKITVSV